MNPAHTQKIQTSLTLTDEVWNLKLISDTIVCIIPALTLL